MTFEVEKTGAKLALIGVVILCGMLGGLAAELLKTRRIGGHREDGVVEGPTALTARFYDLGTPASLILGIIAAALAMGIFQPFDDVAKGTGAAASTVTEYDLWKVVALTLTAGFSAPKFLATAQERLLALVTQERFKTALGDVDEVTTKAPQGDAHRDAVKGIVNRALAPPTAAPPGPRPARK